MSHIFSDKIIIIIIIITSDVFFLFFFWKNHKWCLVPVFIVCFSKEKYSSTLNVIKDLCTYVYVTSFIWLHIYLHLLSLSLWKIIPKMIAQLIKDTLDLFITHQLALYLVFVVIRLTLAARSSPNWRSQWSRSFKNW
jgi:hypothetical protein